ncbi:MAG: hypothetical protein AAF909_13655, partial [Pseudomonadota bacterium]
MGAGNSEGSVAMSTQSARGTGAASRPRFAIWAAAAALLLGSGAAPSPAQAAGPYQCAAAATAPDDFLQGFALTRMAPGGGVEIAVNELRGGVGLRQETKFWLFERQCHLASLAGADPQTGRGGGVLYPLIQHRNADCAAFAALRKRYAGRPNARNVPVDGGERVW